MDTSTLDRAEVLIDLRRFDEARALLARMVASDPSRARAWCLFAYCAHAQEDYPATLEAAEQALAADAENEWAWRLRSVALRKLGREAEALAAARESVRLSPHSWMPYMTLALALNCRAATRTEAWHAAQRAVELAPLEAESHFVAGLVASSRRDLRSAGAAYGRALSLDPEHARARNNLALLELRRGHTAAAATTLSAAAVSDPGLKQVDQNLRAVAMLILHRLWLSAVVMLLASPIVAQIIQPDTAEPGSSVAAPGTATPLTRGVAATVFALPWAAIVTAAARRYPLPVRRYLVRLVVRQRWFAVLTAGSAVGLAGAVAVVAAPPRYLTDVMTVAWLALILTRLTTFRLPPNSPARRAARGVIRTTTRPFRRRSGGGGATRTTPTEEN